jgi:hypothetical protein
MSDINKLLNALKENEFIKSFNPSEADIVDFFGGSSKSIAKPIANSLEETFSGPFDIDDSVIAGSQYLMQNPFMRLLSKPLRMGMDGLMLLADPKWSIMNNKTGLTKDALILNYLFGDDEESNVDEELDNYEQYK